MKLLTQNYKTRKSERETTWVVRIMHLAPAKLSGREMCAGRSPACTFECINTSGYGIFKSVQQARLERTRFYWDEPERFEAQVIAETRRLAKRVARRRKFTRGGLLKLAVRLNGTSDRDFTRVIEANPAVQFYDYTKVWERYVAWLRGELPRNYYLVWSLSETPASEAHARWALAHGGSVAVVAAPGAQLEWLRSEVPHDRGRYVNGDKHDLRFLDPPGSVVILEPKGKAKNDKKGFVIR